MAKIKLKDIKINIFFTKADSKIIFRLVFLFAKKRCQYDILLYAVKEKPFLHIQGVPESIYHTSQEHSLG